MTKSFIFLASLFLLAGIQQTKAQNIDTLLDKGQDILEKGRIYSIKGIGMAFPIGSVSKVLRPRFSTEIGLQILMKNPRYFLYPTIDYVNFNYDQLYDDPKYNYRMKNASAKLYIGTLSGGLITQVKSFRIFSSAGIGGGIINEPRGWVDAEAGEINFQNRSSFTGTLRLNTGVDYGKRTFKLFAELSYLLQTRQIQGSNMHTLAVNIGTRTNLYRLARSIETIKKKL
ncbi:hypothetical protein [Arcticibacter sp. MXS-1]|uniref:hypothetical protein n=1 Tax=Arcticibacter sp. MXS-1 TaxID=3341726 RepID=UPI0035A968D2